MSRRDRSRHDALGARVRPARDARSPSSRCRSSSRSAPSRRAAPAVVLYFAHESEGAQALPWDAERTFVVGEHARARGRLEAPARVISSAKSWLCHPSVDRRAAMLPARRARGRREGLAGRGLVALPRAPRRGVRRAFAQGDDARLAAQEIVLTVPASFDAAARELTVEAAFAAGLENLTLLEEPQAALYAWIARARRPAGASSSSRAT